MVTIDDFKKLEIMIGTVVSVEKVTDADKLLKFVFDIGGEKRQILAGIAEFYPDLDSLVGKQIPVLVNIEPRMMRGLESQGMIMAADDNGTAVLLHPDREIPPGSTVK